MRYLGTGAPPPEPRRGTKRTYGVLVCLSGSAAGYQSAMFVFFSNRLGCLGSLVLSVAVTALLLLIFAR